MPAAENSAEAAAQARDWLHKLLAEAVKRNASDLFLKTGAPPALRIDGEVGFLAMEALSAGAMARISGVVLGERRERFEQAGEADLAHEVEGVGRFRVNVFRQRGTTSIAFRYIPVDIPSFEELNLPVEQLRHMAEQTRGIVLVTGVTGSGKSTTLAAIVDDINARCRRHVVTIEDPIEFVHRDGQSLIEQREVGVDTASFQSALKHVVRQSPDVILIGEMRDRVTIETALNAAEIGHLVLSTLHTANATQTLERVIGYFPPHQHELIRTQLANTMQGILSQQLLVRADGQGRVPAVEVMMRSPTICELIMKGQTLKLEAAMREDTYFGSQSYHEALIGLYRAGTITLETALAASPRPQELRNELQGLRRGRPAAGQA
ncbi:MAG: type IV pilus twitching motility protein PilT [Planctomycetota bacterium]|jgi:twitching motility protein PilT